MSSTEGAVGSALDVKGSPRELDRVAIRFAGDSGDGMQLTGTQFTESTALAGNDLSTFPDFPAEIRAPAGTLAGVSGFQIHFSSRDIHTPADQPDLLIAFNPAALKANIDDVRPSGMVIVNSDSFSKKALARAGYEENPLPALRERFALVEVPITNLNRAALRGLSMGARDIDRSKNFFALGILYWLYNRPMESTERWLKSKFSGEILEANLRTLRAGHAYGETTELFPISYTVAPAKIEAGTYRNITGNTALAWGVIAAGVQLERPVFFGAYPITPASDVLHELARHRHFGLKTFQAEDEMAAVSAAIGASFAGDLGVTASSGPGIVLKQEALGLAVMVELPLVLIDVQRAGPSTGSPTKTEQGDLLLALFGRHSASPMPVLAAATPADCFHTMIEAAQIAVRYMTPVFVLSDSYLANSAEPWKIPELDRLPRMPRQPVAQSDLGDFQPYSRNLETLARPWAIPGTPGLEHRIGGLTKADVSGNVVYDPENHAKMVQLRTEKVARIAQDLPPVEIEGAPEAETLIVGWGGTRGAITAAIEAAAEAGNAVAYVHLRHLNPLPPDLGEVLSRYRNILVPELNSGQLAMLLRAEYLVNARSYTKVDGQPFKVGELADAIAKTIGAEET
ncbi:MAG: 2-oxoacid:acceptor oxidoreductase subunit alpha [Myxococcota bacterium]|nr:2-oxoacid:acceptor oxidoreductase subunit alpha [Myxococcota bacterium]